MRPAWLRLDDLLTRASCNNDPEIKSSFFLSGCRSYDWALLCASFFLSFSFFFFLASSRLLLLSLFNNAYRDKSQFDGFARNRDFHEAGETRVSHFRWTLRKIRFSDFGITKEWFFFFFFFFFVAKLTLSRKNGREREREREWGKAEASF